MKRTDKQVQAVYDRQHAYIYNETCLFRALCCIIFVWIWSVVSHIIFLICQSEFVKSLVFKSVSSSQKARCALSECGHVCSMCSGVGSSELHSLWAECTGPCLLTRFLSPQCSASVTLKGGRGYLMPHPCLESQGGHLIPLSSLLSLWGCSSGGVYVPCIYMHAMWELP